LSNQKTNLLNPTDLVGCSEIRRATRHVYQSEHEDNNQGFQIKKLMGKEGRESISKFLQFPNILRIFRSISH
jgi:hypothetical protein